METCRRCEKREPCQAQYNVAPWLPALCEKTEEECGISPLPVSGADGWLEFTTEPLRSAPDPLWDAPGTFREKRRLTPEQLAHHKRQWVEGECDIEDGCYPGEYREEGW